MLKDQRLGDYLEQLGSADPAPGGGSAGGVAAALGARLGMMALRLARRRAGAGSAGEIDQRLERLEQLSQSFLQLAEADSRAYGEYSRVCRRLRAGEAAEGEVEEAAARAVQVPLDLAHNAAEALDLLARSQALVSNAVMADVWAGARLLHAALQGAWSNVEANLGQLARESQRQHARNQMQNQEDTARESLTKLALS